MNHNKTLLICFVVIVFSCTKEDKLEQILDNGHDWAQDHVSEAKNNMDQVFDFIMNKIRD